MLDNATKFPLDFPKCPVCGSERRVALEALKSEQEQGRCKGVNNAFLYQHQSLIAPNMQFLSALLVITYYDACVDCGTVYCVHAETKTAVQGMSKIPPQQQAGEMFSAS